MSGETIKVYGALWCPDCVRSKQFLDEQRIAYRWIDIEADPAAATAVREKNDGKQIIPTIVFADGSILVEPSDNELALKLGLRFKARKNSYELIIIGGGPAGLTAAIYAARERMDCLVIEKSAPGGQPGRVERYENYPGFPGGVAGAELADRMVAQARDNDVEILSAVAVRGVSRGGGRLRVVTEQGDRYSARAVLIATGTGRKKLGAPGEDRLTGRGVHYCATCDGPLYRGAQEVMVVGGGNAGVEEAIFLSHLAELVRIVEFQPFLTASKVLQEHVLEQPRFRVHTNTEVLRFEGERKLSSVVCRDREKGEELAFNPAAAFVVIGMQPNGEFLRGTVDLDGKGFIVTGPSFHTNLPGVFAAGDVRSGSARQLAAAVGEGVSAFLALRRYLEERPGEPA
jgi:thioredoxin reductase (NADPH)